MRPLTPSSSSSLSSLIGVIISRWFKEKLTLAENIILFYGVMPKGVALWAREFKGVVMLYFLISSKSFSFNWGYGSWIGVELGLSNLLFKAIIAL